MSILLWAVVSFLIPFVFAADNGLALTPPMGWRSWNCYGANVNQQKMQDSMDRMTERIRSVNGQLVSLADLGFKSCGLDDNWQKCKAGVDGSFHDADGNPIINTDLFPDMKAMTDYGHQRGLRVGWYLNNCICSEHEFKGDAIRKVMQGDVNAVIRYNYDEVKLDGCGQFRNLTWWYQLLNATGRPVLIENCHWGQTVPGDTTGDAPCTGTTTPSNCPYHFYRTSGDITNKWSSMLKNLETADKFLGTVPLSRPGTWAYPDMMEVGRMASTTEDRTHFGAWCIVSAPLILGLDLHDESNMDRVWPILSNKEAIAVNQGWYGHPGRPVPHRAPNAVVYAKVQAAGAQAVFVINNDTKDLSETITFSTIGLPSKVKVRDIWAQRDIGVFTDYFTTAKLASHDSAFLMMTPSS